MKFIKFTLSAPLQSWGDNSRWDNRNTANMPTKSGIIGLLGCCLGYPRGDERLNRLDQQLHLAVRSDRAGRIMTDFHTVHGTYGVLLSAEGKKRQNGNTIVSKRQYLQDARFTVFLWGAEADLERCYQAMSQFGTEKLCSISSSQTGVAGSIHSGRGGSDIFRDRAAFV